MQGEEEPELTPTPSSGQPSHPTHGPLHAPLNRRRIDPFVDDSEALLIPGIVLRLRGFLRNVGEVMQLKWLTTKDEEDYPKGESFQKFQHSYITDIHSPVTLRQRKDFLDDMLPSFACAAVETNNVISLQQILFKTTINQGDYSGRTPMHIAAATGNVDMLKFLLYQNAEPTTHDHYGYTPMHDAIRFRNFDVIKILKVKKAKLGMDPTKIGIGLCLAVHHQDHELLRAWYLAGADMDQGDFTNRTAMHIAVSNNYPETVGILLRYGATPLVKDKDGTTAVQEARKRGFAYIYGMFHPRFTEDVTTKEEYLRRKAEEVPGEDFLIENIHAFIY